MNTPIVEDQGAGASSGPGSHADAPSPAVSALSGFDPSRAIVACPVCEGEGEIADGLDDAACSMVCPRCDGNARLVDLEIFPVREPTPVMLTAGNAMFHQGETPLNIWRAMYDAYAQAIEARRAATGTGAVHESAVGNADAPDTSRNPTHPNQSKTV